MSPKAFLRIILLCFILILFVFIHDKVKRPLQSSKTSAGVEAVPSRNAPRSVSEYEPEEHSLISLTERSEPQFVPTANGTESFVEIVDSCDAFYSGACVRGYMHIDGELVPVKQFREGIVLRASTSTLTFNDTEWYEVLFDEWLRYPERRTSELYVKASEVNHFTATGSMELQAHGTSTKRIIVDRSEQQLYAYDGETLFMSATTSTGLDLTPTPRGTFVVYRKSPTRYMQGPIPGVSAKEYDLPGVPWNLYFTEDGAVIHGAYWHNSFGKKWSNGCVNLPPPIARTLYDWADLGTTVIVRD